MPVSTLAKSVALCDEVARALKTHLLDAGEIRPREKIEVDCADHLIEPALDADIRLDHAIARIVNEIAIVPQAAPHSVGSRAAHQHVVADPADKHVEADLTEETVVALMAFQAIIAGTAVDPVRLDPSDQTIVDDHVGDLVEQWHLVRARSLVAGCRLC